MDIQKINFNAIRNIMKRTGTVILAELQTPVSINIKGDDSPVTHADKLAHSMMCEALEILTPYIPILSEEGNAHDQHSALNSRLKWVIDPIDGTNTAIRYASGARQNDQFGIHLALVKDGQPIWGAAHFPAMNDKGTIYYTNDLGTESFKQMGDSSPQKLQASRLPLNAKTGLRAAVHFKADRRPDTLANRDYKAVSGVGGFRLCQVAENAADIADFTDIPLELRHSRGYKQWDLAAGHAILRAAGGELVGEESKLPLTYGNETTFMPSALAGSNDVLKLLDLNRAPQKGRVIE